MTKFLLVPMHDNRRDRSWTSGLESRGDTFDRSQFTRRDQRSSGCSKSRVHVRYAPMRRRHQMVMYLSSDTNRDRKEMRLPALLVAR